MHSFKYLPRFFPHVLLSLSCFTVSLLQIVTTQRQLRISLKPHQLLRFFPLNFKVSNLFFLHLPMFVLDK
jgi:hypothetical protein